MAVIKCKNCENEILDTEIVCPYCDSPVVTEKEKSSEKTSDAAMSGETVKIGTSKDFEKEKAAFLKSMENYDEITNSSTDDTESSQETVKISSKEVTGKSSYSKSGASKPGERKVSPRTSYYQRQAQRKKRRAMLVTVFVGALIIAGLVWLISELSGCSDETVKEVSQPSAESTVVKSDLGFEYKDGILTITSPECVGNYTGAENKPWEGVGTIKHIVIKSGIISIGEHAFEGMTSVETVKIPSSVADIKESAFYECSGLTNVIFDKELSELRIHANAFSKCSSLKSIDFPEKVSSIHEKAFSECTSLKNVKIPGEKTAVDDQAFDYCSDELIIICREDSYAHQYAKDAKMKIQLIDEDGKLIDSDDEDSDEDGDDEETTTKPSDNKDDDDDSKTKPSEQKKDDNDDEDKPSTPSETTPTTNPSTETPSTTTPSESEGTLSPEDEKKLNDLYQKYNNASEEDKPAILDEIFAITG